MDASKAFSEVLITRVFTMCIDNMRRFFYGYRIEGFRRPIIHVLSCGKLDSSSAHTSRRTHGTRTSVVAFNSQGSLQIATFPNSNQQPSTSSRHRDERTNGHCKTPSPPPYTPNRTPPCLMRIAQEADMKRTHF